MSDASSPPNAAPPADRAHDEPAEVRARSEARGRDPHGSSSPPKAHVAHHFHSLTQQFAVEKLGIWLFLATEILMFGGLFCAYAFYRGLHPEVFLYGHQFLPTQWGAINTAVLLTSSLTMAWGVRAAQLNQRGVLKFMLIATFLGGVGFMVIKGIEYEAKFSHDLGPGPGNLFYPVDATAPDSDQLQQTKLEEVHHLEEYYGLTEHVAGAGHGEVNDAEHAEPPSQAPVTTGEGEGGGGVEPSRGASTPPRASPPVAANLPAGERTTVAAPRSPVGGVNPAMLGGDAAQSAHKAYTFAQLPELEQKRMHMFFQIYFLMTGLHGIHVLVGMALIGWLIVRSFRGAFSSVSFTAVDVVGLYWHLVDLIWIFLFPLLYLIH